MHAHSGWSGRAATLFLSCFFFFFIPAAEATDTEKPLLVFAAASLIEVLTEMGDVFEEGRAVDLRFNFAGSSILARQIMMGAPADVFFSADEAKMDQLEAGGLLAPGSRSSLLGNQLVLIARSGSETSLFEVSDLAQPSIRRVALADPRSVPAGLYARLCLESRGLWDAVSPKVIPMANVRGALAALESGNVDAAIVYQTDANLSERVVVCQVVAVEDGPLITYPVAGLLRDRSHPLAPSFLRFLRSDAARELFERYGFRVLLPVQEGGEEPPLP